MEVEESEIIHKGDNCNDILGKYWNPWQFNLIHLS